MKDYNVEPIKSLTVEIIDNLIIHATIGSLRKAANVTPCMKRFDGDESIPTLYYIKGSADPNVDDWSIHALVIDINKYLLLNLHNSGEVEPDVPEDPSTELFVRSQIKWDGVTGKTADGVWVDPINAGEYNEELRFNGEIAWYDADEELGRQAGNRVGVIITPSQEMVDAYPDAEVYFEKENMTLPANEVFYEYEDIGYNVPALYYYPLINVPGQTNVVRIYWDKEAGIEESFPVIILQDATLEKGYQPVTSNSELVEAIAEGGVIGLDADIDLDQPVIIESGVQSTINLNGHNLIANKEVEDGDNSSDIYAVWAKGGDLTIDGDGIVEAADADYSMAVWATGDSKVTIKGGTYVNGGDGCDLIYASDRAQVEIYGGEFKPTKRSGLEEGTQNEYSALNVKDKDRGTASIKVYGGKFYGFNPADNLSEGEHTNFVAEGYESVEVEENVWEVRPM